MSELQIPKVEKQDIKAPNILPGGTAIVLQRHEKYERSRQAEAPGSIFPDAAEAAKIRDLEFFRQMVANESTDAETMVLFVSSDTQYAGKGRRSLETAELAQEAAIKAFKAAGIDPRSRIINLNDNFSTKRHEPTDQDIRPMAHIREPQIFDNPDYIKHLQDKYNKEVDPDVLLSQAAWAAHEMDAEKAVREQMGAEGVYDILDRTKKSVAIFERYSRWFHQANPGKRLIIWADSHYDTISPLVKDATNTSFEAYLPVDYGAGVVMNIAPGSQEVQLEAQSQKVALDLGNSALTSSRQ